MKYSVFSLQNGLMPVAAKTADGIDVTAQMPCTILELVPVGGGFTVTVGLTASNFSGAIPAVGDVVELTIAAV